MITPASACRTFSTFDTPLPEKSLSVQETARRLRTLEAEDVGTLTIARQGHDQKQAHVSEIV